jgi:hypothetical protein
LDQPVLRADARQPEEAAPRRDAATRCTLR